MNAPTTDIDLWRDETLVDPYPAHAALRAWATRLGGQVMLCTDGDHHTRLRRVLAPLTPKPRWRRCATTSTNRDPSTVDDPARFDVGRSNASEHLALGHGRHACPGGHLAKMEIRALMRELVARVTRFEIVDEHRRLNNSIRGLDRLVVRVVE